MVFLRRGFLGSFERTAVCLAMILSFPYCCLAPNNAELDVSIWGPRFNPAADPPAPQLEGLLL